MILAAPLGARTRLARLIGVFSSAKPPKKRIQLICLALFQSVKTPLHLSRSKMTRAGYMIFTVF
jgi:hypothetical protein